MEKIFMIGANELVVNSRFNSLNKLVITYDCDTKTAWLENDITQLQESLRPYATGRPRKIDLPGGFFKCLKGDVETAVSIVREFFTKNLPE